MAQKSWLGKIYCSVTIPQITREQLQLCHVGELFGSTQQKIKKLYINWLSIFIYFSPKSKKNISKKSFCEAKAVVAKLLNQRLNTFILLLAADCFEINNTMLV